MVVSEVQDTKAIGKVQKKEGIHTTRVEDRLSISSESAKRAEWVQMLNEMPDVRPEKIEAALTANPTSLELAGKIIANDSWSNH